VQFLYGFDWAVPRAFCDAVSLYRFEEGDVLHERKEGYMGQDGQGKYNGRTIQVRYPARAGGAERSGKGAVSDNWGSEVRVDIYENGARSNVAQIRTTQGRLYTALWKGDLEILDVRQPEPEIPLKIQSVVRKLKCVVDFLPALSDEHPLFITARDMTNPVSRDKYLRLSSLLKQYMEEPPKMYSPHEVGIKASKDIAPTVEVVFFRVAKLGRDRLLEEIKSLLYRPSKKSGKDGFRLSAHGVIVSKEP